MPATIGVWPAKKANSCRRLFATLERLFEIRFVASDVLDTKGYDAAIAFDEDEECTTTLSRLSCPTLVYKSRGQPRTGSARITFARDSAVDEILRGRVMSDRSAVGTLALPRGSGVVLASCGTDPIWVKRTGQHSAYLASVSPGEIGASETIRDLFAPGRFVGLLSLLHFIREVEGSASWQRPPLRACFVLDDPNLHNRRYGHIDFRSLISHAGTHGYHVSIATIPIDSWLVSRQVAALFRENPSTISLAIHGNNHTYHELNRDRTIEQSVSVAYQALARIEVLERKARVKAARVMVPPHNVCNEVMADALLQTGFEAICVNPWEFRSASVRDLAGWQPSEMVGSGGLPLIPRYLFEEHPDNIPLAAYLGQPIILWGHHQDAADGMDTFAEAADRIGSLGEVRWMGLGDIARSNFATRRIGETLHVRLFSRRVDVPHVDGISRIHAEIDLPHELGVAFSGGRRVRTVIEGRRTRIEPVEVANVSMPLPLELPAPRAESAAVGSRMVWPICRRLMTELRDRLGMYGQEIPPRWSAAAQ